MRLPIANNVNFVCRWLVLCERVHEPKPPSGGIVKSAIGNKIELPRRAIALAGFFLFGLNLVASGFAQARAATHDEELKLYAVNIFRTPPQPWPGYGIYLGNGLVITAAHVVGHAYLFNPKVLIAGQTLEAKVVKEGDFEKVDLTLLSIDARRLPARIGLRLMPLCDAPPSAGQSVVVATPEAVARSRVLSPHTSRATFAIVLTRSSPTSRQRAIRDRGSSTRQANAFWAS